MGRKHRRHVMWPTFDIRKPSIRTTIGHSLEHAQTMGSASSSRTNAKPVTMAKFPSVMFTGSFYRGGTISFKLNPLLRKVLHALPEVAQCIVSEHRCC